jgi:hypothetical protein
MGGACFNKFQMRKTILSSDPEVHPQKSSWLDVKEIAQVEVTSEDSRYPIESAFEEDGHGWRSAEVGEQTIKLVFDQPQRIQRIRLCFIESDTERTQQFALQWSPDHPGALHPVVRQQWNFSPSGSTMEIEEYDVNLNAVRVLQLVINPEISKGSAIATIASWRLA